MDTKKKLALLATEMYLTRMGFPYMCPGNTVDFDFLLVDAIPYRRIISSALNTQRIVSVSTRLQGERARRSFELLFAVDVESFVLYIIPETDIPDNSSSIYISNRYNENMVPLSGPVFKPRTSARAFKDLNTDTTEELKSLFKGYFDPVSKHAEQDLPKVSEEDKKVDDIFEL